MTGKTEGKPDKGGEYSAESQHGRSPSCALANLTPSHKGEYVQVSKKNRRLAQAPKEDPRNAK